MRFSPLTNWSLACPSEFQLVESFYQTNIDNRGYRASNKVSIKPGSSKEVGLTALRPNRKKYVMQLERGLSNDYNQRTASSVLLTMAGQLHEGVMQTTNQC